MPAPDATPRRRPRTALLELQRQLRDLLGRCEAPELEGIWLDQIGKEESLYLDAALCRRELGLGPVPGRRMPSADWPVEPDWPELAKSRGLVEEC